MSWIGVVDSGVGGLSVWRELRREMPLESMLYYADTASCPYGGRGREQIIELTRSAVAQLMAYDPKIIVVACNTMTAAAISALRAENPDTIFVGMEPAVKPAAGHSRSGVVGILATEATLRGDLYRNTKEQYASRVEVIEVAGTGLVEMVERGEQDSAQCEALLREYIDPMVARGADTLVLGCTHFPFLRGAIRRIYGDELMLEDPAGAVARRVSDLLAREGLAADLGSVAEYRFLSSAGQEDAHRVAQFAASIFN